MKPSAARATAVALALVILAACLGACGSKSENTMGEAEKLTLDLDFYPNPDHAGIYMAEEEGFFTEAGLDVTIELALGPRGAAEGGRRRPRRPGDHLRAGGDARAREGP